MIDTTYTRRPLCDICNIDRGTGKGVRGKTVYIRISATDGEVHMANAGTVLSNDVAIITPRQYMPVYYLHAIIQREFPQFMSRYVGTNINIQFDSLKYLQVNVHDSIETQCYYAKLLEGIEKSVEEQMNAINGLKKLKSAMLARTMC